MCRVPVHADLFFTFDLHDPGIVDNDFDRSVADLSNGAKDRSRQVMVCFVEAPVDVWHRCFHLSLLFRS